ncbi:amino acid/amide ABC transporter membrane protein 2 (HAAT family) [Tepidamorphus gemmatus]|uniref:Amino acid/amide ABC transporter membrane protein 2 (HAAT family) n=1 Tax=Tepidamorphus gemmatus TaxID=747076 RepID=A0A4R3MIS3_9HYPH|nr:branched-chain amino acid ABC transporter permease [Tepidamorphus gemmatus]TCT13254.1 amino acid/amide ABC transporter membrane protein 2 (HAAT family) [Tepidamorphus gemmatus]
MLYREAGQFKTSYEADQAVFPILQDRIGVMVILAVAVAIPFFASNFVLASIMIPFLIFALATIGLNVLTGYAGQLSLGTGAFMGVGAYSCYKLTTFFPDVNIIVLVLLSGLFSAGIGMVFGLPSLRIKGLYLAVTTLAAQFFLEWCFIRIPWLYNYNHSGAIEVPERTGFGGVVLTGPAATPFVRYFVVLAIVVAMTIIVKNILRGRIGRSWMMIRDMDIAAELIGVRPLVAKLSAFAVSSYICGVAGAMMVFFWLGAAEASAFAISLSFQILFMAILGGLGSLIGCFFGSAFIWALPVVLRLVLPSVGIQIGAETVEHLTQMIIGALIILFLIVEPHGLARLWQIAKEKLRVWPFPYA